MSFIMEGKPLTVVDAYNRMCASLGSLDYALRSYSADYNGHHYRVTQTLHGYFTCTYVWCGLNTVARGSLLDCAAAAAGRVKTLARGASAEVDVPVDFASPAALDALHALGYEEGTFHAPGGFRRQSWWTWRHQVAARSAPDRAARQDSRVLRVFDLALLEASESPREYGLAVVSKYGLGLRPETIPERETEW